MSQGLDRRRQDEIAEKVHAGERLTRADGEDLYACTDLAWLGELAHHVPPLRWPSQRRSIPSPGRPYGCCVLCTRQTDDSSRCSDNVTPDGGRLRSEAMGRMGEWGFPGAAFWPDP